MVTRNDLAWLYDAELTRPIGGLLDERGVEFGDDYSRAALEAFALDRDLQCMPYGISPMVIYYNRALVDFEAMEARGLDVPSGDENERWTFEEFRVAAEFAARPRRGTSGFHVDADPRGLGAVHLLRRRPDVRRRRGPHVAGVLLRRDPLRARGRAAGAARPPADPDPGAARRGVGDDVVRERPARHDRRLPVVGSRAPAVAGPRLRRDRDADGRRRGDGGPDHRPLHRRGHRRTSPSPPTCWST